jgi:hypothetical protein
MNLNLWNAEIVSRPFFAAENRSSSLGVCDKARARPEIEIINSSWSRAGLPGPTRPDSPTRVGPESRMGSAADRACQRKAAPRARCERVCPAARPNRRDGTIWAPAIGAIGANARIRPKNIYDRNIYMHQRPAPIAPINDGPNAPAARLDNGQASLSGTDSPTRATTGSGPPAESDRLGTRRVAPVSWDCSSVHTDQGRASSSVCACVLVCVFARSN